jgi:PhzF family phenazine biosynthesis protein
MKVDVQIVNAFVFNDKGGNPAGVVLDADQFSSEEKLKIAAKVGVSETAFVSQSSIADFKLDFFTPNRQIAHCGHATIATFSYLAQLGKVPRQNSSKETIDGRREILLKGELAFMEQRAPSYFEPISLTEKILASLGITKTNLVTGKPISVVNTGNSFLIIPIHFKDTLKDLKPNMKLIHEVSDELDLIGFYPFTLETFEKISDASTRMFGPRYAITEEAGTGMAAGPLACYLYDVIGFKKTHLVIEQGWLMNPASPSQIVVDLEIANHKIQRLMAGGKGLVSESKIIDI